MIETTPPTTPLCFETIAQNELLPLTNIETPQIGASFVLLILLWMKHVFHSLTKQDKDKAGSMHYMEALVAMILG